MNSEMADINCNSKFPINCRKKQFKSYDNKLIPTFYFIFLSERSRKQQIESWIQKPVKEENLHPCIPGGLLHTPFLSELVQP